MIDISRIRYFLSRTAPAQVVHTEANVLDAAVGRDAMDRLRTPRLLVTIHDGPSGEGIVLRIGQSLILHERHLTVPDAPRPDERFMELDDPLRGRLYELSLTDRSLTTTSTV